MRTTLAATNRLMAGLRIGVRCLFLVTMSLQVAGIAHPIGEVIEMMTPEHHQAAEADNDAHESDPSHQCPPGCPTCHHVHIANAPLVLYVAPCDSVPVVMIAVVSRLTYSGDASSSPDRSSIYRPPRSISLA